MTDKPDLKEAEPINERSDFTKGLTVGRMVHVVADGGQCVAAVVSGVIAKERGQVVLHCFLPSFDDTAPKVVVIKAAYSDSHVPGTWHWPEYVA